MFSNQKWRERRFRLPIFWGSSSGILVTVSLERGKLMLAFGLLVASLVSICFGSWLKALAQGNGHLAVWPELSVSDDLHRF